LSKQPAYPKFQRNFFRFKQFLWGSIDWLFPPVCAGCGEPGFRFCPNCIQKIRQVTPQNCVFCGKSEKSTTLSHHCPKVPFIDRGLAWGLHSGPLRKGLHRFKYQRDLGLAETFSGFLTGVFLEANQQVDLIVPVPLGRKRQKERGYNQAYLLASACAGRIGIPCRRTALKRVRETKSQVGLSIEQRHQNVAGAFKAVQREVQEKNILLIDDVLTTGATLNSCAEALKQAGAKQIISLTLARAP
jgi:ComF family protein